MKNESFLQTLAERCYQQYGRDADKLTIIFPNRRAGLFFRKHLSTFSDKPIWSPTVTSLEDYIISKSRFTLIEHLHSVFALFQVYRSLNKKHESFEKFYYWGEMILKDFDDIDNHLVNPSHVFSIVSSQKELDDAFYYLSDHDQKVIKSFWSGFIPKASKTQSDFLKTWMLLHELYSEFKSAIEKEEKSTKGGIYRDVAENLDELLAADEGKDLWFAGFNALNKAEEKVIKYCVSNFKANIYWDLDQYYINDEDQEAGFFLRAHQKDQILGQTFPSPLPDVISQRSEPLEVVSAPLFMSQLKSVGEKIWSLTQRDGFKEENTAILLPDENLLVPLLNSLPDSIQKINVTMGYPLRESIFFSFFESILDLHINKRSHDSGKFSYYYRDVLKVIEHEICKSLFPQECEELYTHLVQRPNRIFADELVEISSNLSSFFKVSDSVNDFLNSSIDFIHKNLDDSGNHLDRCVLEQMQSSFQEIKESIEEYKISLGYASLKQLYKQLGTSIKIPFSGEPFEGIQVMGLMESRNLDFENVFILSMNEGTFPSDQSNNSFIPYNIRKAFDLPTHENHDALQAYLFYRLLQSDSQLFVYYNNISEFNHNGEPSRYLKQLELESDIKLIKKHLIPPLELKAASEITIPKTDWVISILNQYLAGSKENSRLSPSALNTYLDCRLKFYFKYVEKLKEKDEPNDELDPALFGNLMHFTLEHLYQQCIDEGHLSIEPEQFKTIKQNVATNIDEAFKCYKMQLDGSGEKDGRYIIAKEVILNYVEAILKHDKKYAPFQILELEAGQGKGYQLDVPVEINGRKIEVALKGVIDRIDKKDHTVRILDYKSGGDERYVSNLEALFDRSKLKRNKAIMQVLFYCLLYENVHGHNEYEIKPGIFNSKDLFNEDFDTSIKIGKQQISGFQQMREEYVDLFTNLLKDIFDPEVPFDQTEDRKKCEYCPYSGICMRK